MALDESALKENGRKRKKDVKESCKLRNDICHVVLLSFSLILLSILSFKNKAVIEI
jgi:hypothetical protein